MTGGGMGSLRNELEELLGTGGIRMLAEARGGRRAYIPRRIPDGHWIERALGRERADLLAFRYGGCRIDVPRRPSPGGRDASIRNLRASGRSVSSIAAEAGISERHVRRILGR